MNFISGIFSIFFPAAASMGMGVCQWPEFGGSKKTTFFSAKLAHGEVTNLKNPPQFALSNPKFLPN
jgi:hypothetical protein